MVRKTLAILLLVLVAGVPSVYGHTTLGNLNGNAPLYRSNDNELNPTNTLGGHAPGPLGYVWPGSGLDTYSGIATNPPGYQSPFSSFEEPVQQNSYAPEGAILASTAQGDSVGDLVFAINFSQPHVYVTPQEPRPNFTYSTVALYIPAPVADKYGAFVQDGFQPEGVSWDQGENTNIVTTITSDYSRILITRADASDPFSPGSWLVLIAAPITFTAARQWKEWYYIRINDMRAPHIAGRYFFKIFLDNHYPVRRQSLTDPINGTMPMENWPVLLVKEEVDPAIVSGTLRFGDLSNSALYGLPLSLPGMVRLIGIAIDPVTGVTTGRAVEARGYFNATSKGHFEVEGVAPGMYDAYASAAGFPEQRIAEGLMVARAQSLKLDGYLKMGPELRGVIISKQEFGLVPWPGQRPISIIIYDSNTYDSASIVTQSPSNLTHAPYSSYVDGNTQFKGNGLLPPNIPKQVAFPWEGPLGYYPLTPPPTFKDPFGIFNGVGPAQSWWVDPANSLNPITSLGSSGAQFSFQFGSENAYGIPAELSGMIPQVFATWTDGLKAGTYYVRAFVNGYIQSSVDGREFVDYSFTVPQVGARDFSVEIDLQESNEFSITVHFHNLPRSLQDAPIQGPDPSRFLIAEAFSSNGTLAAFNFTQVTSSSSTAVISLNGLGMAGPLVPPDPRALIKYSLARYQRLYDYGLPPDTYTIRVYMRGFIQAQPPATSTEELDWPLIASLTLGSGVTLVSTHMYRGGSINATVLSIDWELPLVERNWVWQNAPLTVLVYDAKSQGFVDAIYVWNSNLKRWMIPFQDSNSGILPWPQWKSFFGNSASFLVTNGSVYVDRFGPDLPNQLSKEPSQDMATSIFLQENLLDGFLYNPSYYRTGAYSSKLAIYPGVYALNVWTYGYVQTDVTRLGDLGDVRVSIGSMGSQADSDIHAIIGPNFTLRMMFKKEDIFSGIPYNMSVRIRLLDDSGALVAAATLSSDAGELIPASNSGFFADDRKLLSHPTVPAGTMTLEYSNLAGLFEYVEPSSSQLSVERLTLFSADHGIWARSTYEGSYVGPWTVIVDMMNWYLPNEFYAPVPGLLQGESPEYFTYNHLGPYRQVQTTISNVVLEGEGSVQFELDLRGYAQGLVLGLDLSDDVRTVSWATVKLRSGGTDYYWYTWDGWFDGYLDPGEYQLTVTYWSSGGEGYTSQEFALSVSAGQFSRGLNIILEQSGIPIPEFSSHTLSLGGILFLCLYLTNARLHKWRRGKYLPMYGKITERDR